MDRPVIAATVAIVLAAVPIALGWLTPFRPIEFMVLLGAATMLPMRNPRRWCDVPAMPPAVLFDVLTLLIFGPHAASLTAGSRIVAQTLACAPRVAPLDVAVQVSTAVAAMQAAGVVLTVSDNVMPRLGWPWQAVPAAIALAVYFALTAIATRVIAPMMMRRPAPADLGAVLHANVSAYVICAGLAIGLADVVSNHRWLVLAVLAVPLGLLYRAYEQHLERLEHEHRRREVSDALDEGVCGVDRDGLVTFWDPTVERLLHCSRERALGGSVDLAVPALAKTEVPAALKAVLTDETTRTLDVTASLAGGRRVLHVKIMSVPSGATLVWQDVTDRRAPAPLAARAEERLAIAAAGASDGLWAWDLSTQDFYASPRWCAMLGLEHASGHSNEWLSRIHSDDLAGLKDALQSHLTGKTDYVLHDHRLRHADGSYRWFSCRGVATRGANGRSVRIGGSLSEAADRPGVAGPFRSAGMIDALTGLCNRNVFVEMLGCRLAETKERRRSDRFAVLYLDLDRFKVVNDSLGHLVGDELLIAVSRRLESCLRTGDTLARLGGDEFVILLNGLSEDQQANALAFRIQEVLSTPFQVAGREVFTSASIGIAFGLSQYNDPDEIMRDADTAMYHAKSRGKARHEMFDADMHARVRDRLGLESDLRHAVLTNDFDVHYQPIVSLASGMCIGFESLVRWTRNGEPVSPVTFVPMAEELGLIEPLGSWVLEQACHTFAEWQRRFPNNSLDCITVNVSSRQLMQHNFRRVVEKAVCESGLSPSALRIELTETALMDNPTEAAELLRELRDFGVKIYLDDFGTGYSSLTHLHKLPVDALKIDRSFVKSLLLPDRPAIVESVLALARTLNTSVVAEGIETRAQAHELERLGCTHAQGFLFSKPLPRAVAEEMLAANLPLGPKRVSDAAAPPPLDGFTPAGPFEWPAHVHVNGRSDADATAVSVDNDRSLAIGGAA